MNKEIAYRVGVVFLLTCILGVQIAVLVRIPVVRVAGSVDVEIQNSSLSVDVENTPSVQIDNTPLEVQIVR